MGYVSFVEDLRDRLSDDLDQLERAIDLERDDLERLEYLRGWIIAHRLIVAGLNEQLAFWVEIASDPSIEPAHRIADLEAKNTLLNTQLTDCARACKEAEDLKEIFRQQATKAVTEAQTLELELRKSNEQAKTNLDACNRFIRRLQGRIRELESARSSAQQVGKVEKEPSLPIMSETVGRR